MYWLIHFNKHINESTIYLNNFFTYSATPLETKAKVFTPFLHVFHGSMEIPPWKTPTRKILTHQTLPSGESPSEYSNKIPTWIIPTHFIN